jgi:hypothetical protein
MYDFVCVFVDVFHSVEDLRTHRGYVPTG